MIYERDLIATRDAIRQWETSPADDLALRIARIEKLNGVVNAVLQSYPDQAQAAPTKPLAGLALGHKNLIARKGRVLSYGAGFLRDQRASTTASVLERLDRAGGFDLADLQMTEFAQGSTGHNPHYGDVKNPWNIDHISGGSSSGSGAAVACGMVLGSLGSDTAGSIRLPASACGVTGLKPTHGLVSLAGTMPLAPSFDTIGPLARSARDCALLLGLCVGAERHYSARLDGNLKGMRIGLPRQYFLENIDPSIQSRFDEALAVLTARGASLVAVDLPLIEEIPICLTLALRAEVAAQHLDWLRARFEDYAEQLATRIMPSTMIPTAAYITALRKRPAILAQYAAQVFDKVDVLACPTIPVSLPKRVESDLEQDPDQALRHYGRIAQNTGFASYLGLPAISLPMGFCDRGLPTGLQLIARPYGEPRLCQIGEAYQRDTNWHLLRPTGVDYD